MKQVNELATWLRTHSLIVICFLVGVISVAFFTYTVVQNRAFFEKKSSETTEFIEDIRVPSPSPTPDPLRPYTVLLLGYGGPGHDGGSLTDTMLLAYVVPKEQRAVLFSLPRDLWVEVPLTDSEKQWSKINTAFAIGNDDRKYAQKPEIYTGTGAGGRLSKAVVSEILGISVDYYVAVDFSGFTAALDTLGPLSVYVPVAFDDNFYPIAGKENETCEKSEEEIEALTATMSGYTLEQQFDCRYEQLHFDAGLQKLDAETALKFVRSRHSEQNGGDFGRAQRQQALLSALKDMLLTPSGILRLVPTSIQLMKYVQTDITAEKIKEVVTTHPKLSEYELSTVRLTDDNALVQGYSADRQYILQPKSGPGDWSSVREFFQDEVVMTSN